MYTIKQHRKLSDDSNYISSITGYDIDYVKKYEDNKTYGDACIGNSFENGKSYYATIRIPQRSDGQQVIYIRLKNINDNVAESNYQNLLRVTIDSSSSSTTRYHTYDLMFTPNANYNGIVLELDRTSIDSDPNSLGLNGRLINLTKNDVKLYEIKNLIGKNSPLNMENGITEIQHIGVRGEPGQLMCINGEEIYINPSGVYELYNGVPITYLGFVPQKSNITSNKSADFIVDYLY